MDEQMTKEEFIRAVAAAFRASCQCENCIKRRILESKMEKTREEFLVFVSEGGVKKKTRDELEENDFKLEAQVFRILKWELAMIEEIMEEDGRKIDVKKIKGKVEEKMAKQGVKPPDTFENVLSTLLSTLKEAGWQKELK